MSLLLILLLITHFPITISDPREEVIGRACLTGHVTNFQNYTHIFHTITSEMENDIKVNKSAYAQGTVFSNNNYENVFVFAQCLNDLSNDDCSSCFATIRTLLPGCFPSPGGRVYLDGCYIRVDNYDFYTDGKILDNLVRCGDTVTDNQEQIARVEKVLVGLKNNAPENNGYAELQDTDSSPGVYGMANCWKNMNLNSCASCLRDAYNSAMTCLPSTEGRVTNTGCFIRYSDYKFSNDVPNQTSRDVILAYTTYIIGVVAFCLIAVGVGFCLGNSAYRQLQIQPRKTVKEVDKRSLNFLQFKYSTLQSATQNFSPSCRIGQGGFGEVFKGTLKDGRELAVKHLFMNGRTRSEDIYTEVDIISKAQHKNLVRFLGCCFTETESYIIYEYLANRSLDCVLFDPVKKKELDWKKRLGIITGTARGLEYLHTECQVKIIHRDIKASNILLDLRYRPKIADFGLARFSSCDKSFMNTAIAGTLGYMAPEYLAHGKLTEKIDVYSFGVLVLEIVSGVQNNKFEVGDSLETLVTCAWRLLHQETSSLSEIIDRSLDTEYEEEIKRTIHIGLLCTQEVPTLRPTMREVIEMLAQNNMELPSPGKPPFMIEYVPLIESSKWYDANS